MPGYDSVLKRRIVQRYLREEFRAPTPSELKAAIQLEKQKLPVLDKVGFCGNLATVPSFRKPASAEEENSNVESIMDDLEAIELDIDRANQMLHDGAVGLQATTSRLQRALQALEERCNNLLLTQTQKEVFLGFVEENFDTQDKVDFTKTTAKLEGSSATLGRDNYTSVSSEKLKLRATTISPKNVLSGLPTKPIATLLNANGEQWQYLVYTQYQTGRVSLVLELEFDEKTYVGDVRLDASQLDMASDTVVTKLYSTDGQSFKALQPGEEPLNRGENLLLFGLEAKKIQLLISKQHADNLTANSQWVYVFSFSHLRVNSDRFNQKKSVLVMGPYDVKDHNGNPLSFTKAKIHACGTVPEGTSIDFELSNDSINWFPIDWRGDGNKLVSFGSSAASNSGQLDSTLDVGVLNTSYVTEDLQQSKEAYLNDYIPAISANKSARRLISVKRNLSTSVYGAPAGWRKVNSEYQTTIVVTQPEGRWIDLGRSHAKLNSYPVTGRVFLPEGESIFATSDRNYLEIDETLSTASDLRDADPLYPYNHKYLIEGYPYISTFSGEQVYSGVSEYYAILLRYLTPEGFALTDALDVFTVTTKNGDWLIKVNANKADSTWRNETFSLDWKESAGASSQLWVRATLNSSSDSNSPRLDKFLVRVI